MIDYFAKKRIPFDEPRSGFAFLKSVLTGSIVEVLKRMYQSRPNEKLFGFYNRAIPGYFLRDPTVIKKIAIKDFDYFVDHRALLNPDHDTLFGNMLVVLRGQKWRDMRSALSPAFTGNKMRLMFELVSQCGMQFAQFCEDECTKNGPRVYDMKEIFSKFTNDVIASCAFGIHCDSLRDSGNSFFQMGKKFLDFYSLRAMFKFLTILYTPKIARYFDITFFNNESKRLFVDIITKNMETRERENIIRPDMIHLLMQLKKGQLKETSANTTEDSIGAAEEFSIKNAKGSIPLQR
ncbi:unnamed protein product [Hermetia illucens]|uniref:Cytochrome P450 n=1 Tax=Hermetia illucens TaxID=343691 RepID=A0A7R8UYJ8_HERIL|nr:unnamed protein product [Hermetia illucens]